MAKALAQNLPAVQAQITCHVSNAQVERGKERLRAMENAQKPRERLAVESLGTPTMNIIMKWA